MKHRPPRKITSRVSSVTNGFVQAIIPDLELDSAVRERVLAILEINPDSLTCAYCGSPAHHWDHLNSYVRRKRPSGFINEARNLVPACGPCNTSKSGAGWREWILGSAKGSPTSRGVSNISDRVLRLEQLEAEFRLEPIDLASMVDPDLWQGYWGQLAAIEQTLHAAQRDAEKIRSQITVAMRKHSTE